MFRTRSESRTFRRLNENFERPESVENLCSHQTVRWTKADQKADRGVFPLRSRPKCCVRGLSHLQGAAAQQRRSWPFEDSCQIVPVRCAWIAVSSQTPWPAKAWRPIWSVYGWCTQELAMGCAWKTI